MPSACLSLILFVFGPSQIYLTNQGEFSVLYLTFLWNASILSILFCLLLLVFFGLLYRFTDFYQRVISLTLSLSILLSLQTYFIVWNYGLLDGTPIPWNEHLMEGIFDGTLWVFVMAIAWLKFKKSYSYAKQISVAILFFHCLSLIFHTARLPELPSSRKYGIDESGKFIFSKNKNVIILVLDAFQTDFFQEIINKDKQYEEFFQDFVYFRNSLAGHPFSETSTMNILTGEYYDGRDTFEKHNKRAYSGKSIPKVLKENGFQAELYPGMPRGIFYDETIASNIKRGTASVDQTRAEFVYLLDVSLFRQLPTFLKMQVYNNQEWLFTRRPDGFRWLIRDSNKASTSHSSSRHSFSGDALQRSGSLRFIDKMARSAVRSEEPGVFKYYHLDLPHSPLRINEHLEYERMAQTRRNFRRQCEAALRIAKLILEELKRIDAYDNSLIFIVADHGAGAQKQRFSNRARFPLQPDQSLVSDPKMVNALPLFLIKRFHAKGALKISDAPVTLSDIRPTIFAELGIRVDCPGKSVFEVSENEPRTRRYIICGRYDSTRDMYLNLQEWLVTGYSWVLESWRPSYRKGSA